MSYNSKYTGQQVEALLDIVSQGGGTGGEGGEVQKTTEAEIIAMGFTKNQGTVTSVTAGEGLEGGTIADSGTISLAKKTQNDTYIDLMSKFDILEIGNTSSDTNVTIDNTSYVWMDKMLYFDKFGRLDSIEGYYYYPTKVTFGEATTSLKGLMSASDKVKLNGAVTGVKINGTTKNPSSGVVDLGTVITEHQDISGKVDKVDGKQLSTEDFTTALKQKLEGLNNYNDAEINAAVSSLQTQLNTLVSGNANDAINSFNEIIAFLDGIKDNQDLSSIIASIEQQIASKMDKVTLANVATSGSYNDLNDKPTIPSAVTESTVSGWGFTKNTGTYSKPSTGIPKSDLDDSVQTSLGKADTALQSVPSEYITENELTGKNYATNTALQTAMRSTEMKLSEFELSLDGKQPALVSGKNIKTINGTSILGSGNIVIEGGGGSSSGGAYAEVNHGTSDTTFTLTPNTFHVWDEVAALDLSLGDEQAGVANEFLFQFTSGATPTTLTLPDSIKWVNDSAPTIAENTIYQISILNGLAVVLKFSNEIEILENFINIGSGGILNFTYPTNSELTVDIYGRTTGAPSSHTFTIPVGTSSFSTGLTSVLAINSVQPASDSKYNYTYHMS